MKYSDSNAYYTNGGVGAIIRFNITRQINQPQSDTSENHSITLNMVRLASKFTSEESVTTSTSMLIDKIRMCRGSEGAYVDIHTTGNFSMPITVDFDVSTRPLYQSAFAAESLQSVAASPSGETVLTEYTFAPNTAGTARLTAITSRGTITSGKAVYVGRMIHLNFVFTASTTATNSPQIASVPNALYDTALSAIDITSGIGSAITAAIPCGIGTTGKLFLQSITNGHIYAITGDYLV